MRIALAIALTLSSATARAADPRISVETDGCGELDANEIALVLELELEEQAGSWEEIQAPPVSLGCTGDSLRIAVSDPITGKQLERAIPQPALEGRERSIALAISQLFLTSWLELLLPAERRGPMPELPAPQVERATEAARRAVPAESAAHVVEPEGSAIGALVWAHGGGRVRDLAEPFVLAFAAVRAGVEIDRRWSVFAQAAFERGEATRERGTVEATIGDFGVGLGFRVALVELLALEARAVFSALYVRLDGESSAPLVRAGRTEAAAAQGAIEIGPVLEVGVFRAGLSIAAGLTLFAPEGHVSQEAPVRPGGGSFAAQLHLATIL